MKRFLSLLILAAFLLSSCAAAEDLPETTPEPDSLVFAPEDSTEDLPEATQTPAPASLSEADILLDFSNLTLDDPLATPIAVDPIDKPTPTPAPTPNYIYTVYNATQMGVSFQIPYTWLLNPNTNQETTVQFVEPKSEMMEPDGYQTRLTVAKVNMGLTQTASDARTQLESTLEELAQSFTSFTPGNLASASIGEAKGWYCYYKAEYNDGTKTYSMRGRITIVAHDKALYQVRLTAPSSIYSYYEYVFRQVRTSFEFE